MQVWTGEDRTMCCEMPSANFWRSGTIARPTKILLTGMIIPNDTAVEGVEIYWRSKSPKWLEAKKVGDRRDRDATRRNFWVINPSRAVRTSGNMPKPRLGGREQKQVQGTQEGQSTQQQQNCRKCRAKGECLEIPRGIRNAEEWPVQRLPVTGFSPTWKSTTARVT